MNSDKNMPATLSNSDDYSNSDNEIQSSDENKREARAYDESKSKSRYKYNDYMKNYMREYRKKQKLQQEENKHCCCICNKLCKDSDVEALIKKSIQTLINIINDHSELISDERISRINDNKYDFFKYAELIIETVEELRK